ncbi:hypothetical protein BDV97DRAFT_40003 [Delphinella strobiligena]|nr:hypothetical protein BDV97DRAFT_40003 [Delphinella strobiligena]
MLMPGWINSKLLTVSSIFTTMHLLRNISTLIALASCVACAAIEQRSTCNTDHVAFVEQRTTHTIAFCDFFLSYPRASSPFTLLSASDTWAACECITASAKTPRQYKKVTAPTASECSAYTKILTNEYEHPPAFCLFYMAQGRVRSPIPGVTVAELQKGCSCLSSTTSTTAQASTTTTTRTSTTSTALTTTSTCSNNVLATTVGDFVSGLAYWTSTASPTAYASVATGTSYDSTGSAALLKCEYSSDEDAHASVCSKQLAVCSGQNYTVSFKYKFPASSSNDGSLSLYDYGLDDMLDTITGPVSGGSDGTGVAAGSWGSLSSTFEAAVDDDTICVMLQCLSSTSLAGKTAQVLIDNVRVTRVV